MLAVVVWIALVVWLALVLWALSVVRGARGADAPDLAREAPRRVPPRMPYDGRRRAIAAAQAALLACALAATAYLSSAD